VPKTKEATSGPVAKNMISTVHIVVLVTCIGVELAGVRKNNRWASTFDRRIGSDCERAHNECANYFIAVMKNE
jgi:hypothetical protein